MTFDDMIDRDEGVSHVAYPDPLTRGDPWTIGKGHTGPEVHEGLVWNDDQIEDAYQLDKAAAWQGCVDHFPWFDQLNDARQAVLWSMAYQMGVGRLLGFANTLDAIRDEHYATAAENMRQSVWAHQTPKRAIRLAYQMESGAWQ